MKVLCLTNMYPTDLEPWFGSFVRDQVEELRAIDIEVDVLSFDGRRANSAYAGAVLSLRRALQRDPTYDIVHAHFGLTGAVASTQQKLPVITTFHGTDAGHVRWKRNISWLVARRTIPIFVSERGAEVLGLRGAPVIPAGVDTTLFTPGDRVEARRSLGWKEEGTYLLFPGAPSVAVKNVRLFDAVVEELRERGHEVSPVHLAGYSRQEVAHVMRAVDALVMTSISEGSPVAVKEALASGTRVVSVDVGDVRSVIGGLAGCAICERDREALADGILSVLDAELDLDALVRRASDYSQRHMAERVARIYEKVAA